MMKNKATPRRTWKPAVLNDVSMAPNSSASSSAMRRASIEASAALNA
jgi:hypothetical protein